MHELPTLTLDPPETVLSLRTLPRTGTFRFSAATYDPADDRLHLTAGPPAAAWTEITPEGHVLRISAPDQRIARLTLVDVRRRLARDGWLSVTLGEGQVATLTAGELAGLLAPAARSGRFTRHA